MYSLRKLTTQIAIVAGSLLFVSNAIAQLPFDEFEDPASGDICGVVNTANFALVVSSETGELIVVEDVDVFIEGSFVEDDLTVFFDDTPFGVLDFAEDEDGLAALWWLTFGGTVVELDPLTLEPFDSGLFPDELESFCDACEFWDEPEDCESCEFFDTDDDGVDDCIDECPDTQPGEISDDFGCSCEDLDDCVDECEFFDEDDDGVNDCDDLCPDTPFDLLVDDDGCEIIIIDDDDDDGAPPIFVSCAAIQPWFVGFLLLGFAGFKGLRRSA